MVSTTINFAKEDVQPPVYVAGSFTDWSPVEMEYETSESNGSVQNKFSYKATLTPGEYQYKFRLGPGDWWVLDESGLTATDESGNVNNVLLVEAQKPKASFESPAETIPTPPAHVLNTRDAYIMDDDNTNRSADQEGSGEPYPPPEEIVATLADTHAAEQPEINAIGPEVGDEHSGRVTAEAITDRKDSIPDIAPPPYSVAANERVPEPIKGDQAAPVAEAAEKRQLVQPKVVRSQPEGKQQSFIARICGGNGLIMIIAMIAVPIAVSYYLRR